MTLCVGLTGSIGSGKTAAAEHFESLNVPVFDADKMARTLCDTNTPIYKKIIKQFGSEILNADDTLNRARLRTLIFQDNEKRRWLEDQFHPAILQHMKALVGACNESYCICVIPLLTEARVSFDFIDRVLVIDANEALCRERAQRRDQNAETLIDAILATQCTRGARLLEADDVITNEESLEALHARVDSLHAIYRKG